MGGIPYREFCSRSPGHNGHPASCMTTSPGWSGGAHAGQWEDSQAGETEACGGSMAAQPRTALGTIPGTACLRMVTFSTPVSTYPSLVGPEVLTRLSAAGRWQGLLGLSRFWAQHLSQCLPSILGHHCLGRKQSPRETDSMCTLAGRDPGRSSTACTDISSPHAGTGCAGKSGSTTFLPRPPGASS